MKKIGFIRLFLFLAGWCMVSPSMAVKNKGTLSNLVCFVRFQGEENTSGFDRSYADYEKLFNDNAANANSVYNYFYQASYGELYWKSTLFPKAEGGQIISYQARHERGYYQEQSSINEQGYTDEIDKAAREQALVREIADFLSSSLPDEVVLDADNNGTIDNICIVLSGRSEVGSRHLLWPHRSDLALPDEKAIYVKGKKMVGYLLVFDGANGWSSLQPIPLNTGVICHEMSHSLGTYDLYHVNDKLNPVGVWDLMSDNLTVPQHMSAYTKYRYCGWLDEIPEISAPGTYTLNPLGGNQKEKVAYKIKPIGSDEYFIVEYRKKEGTFDSGLPESGLLVYRINPAYTGGNTNYNGTTRLDEVYIFRLGGTLTEDGQINQASFSQESGRTTFGGDAVLKPFYSNGTEARFALTNISSCGETLSFDLVKLGNQIKLSDERIVLSGKSGEKMELEVESDVSWKVEDMPEWLTITPKEGPSGKTKIVLETVSANQTAQSRTVNLVFTSPADESLKSVLSVSQQSDIILPPTGLTARMTSEGGVALQWTAPQEGLLMLRDGFEDTANPNGWTIRNYGDRGWGWQEAAKYYMPYEGNYSLYMKSAWEDIHQDEWLISPVFAGGKTLTFYSNSIAPKKSAKDQFYYVEVSMDGGKSWTPVYDLMKDCEEINQYVQITIDLSDYQSEQMRVAFHAYDTNNTGLSYWWQIDQVEIYADGGQRIEGYTVYRNGRKIAETTECAYTDPQPQEGENTYTVRALGDFGETSDSEAATIAYNPSHISDVSGNASAVTIIVTHGKLVLHATDQLKTVELLTADGRRVYNQEIDRQEAVINTASYPSGVYLLVYKNKKTGRMGVKKVVLP